MHNDWIVPDWPAPRQVKALITTRAGGVSTGPYATFNLGWTTGDNPQAVLANRDRLSAVLPAEPRWLRQVHGAHVAAVDDARDEPIEADAAVTHALQVVCAILVADCLPILLADRAGSIVGAAHAGWRGLAGGVVDNTVAEMTKRGALAGDLIAYIGPGIGAQAFEVGADVHQTYTTSDTGAAAAFTPHGPGKWLADLVLLARRALERAGVTHVYSANLCTFSDPERFYSYRRDKVTGRMGAFIWIEDAAAGAPRPGVGAL